MADEDNKYYQTTKCQYVQKLGFGLYHCLSENGCPFSHCWGDSNYCLLREIKKEEKRNLKDKQKLENRILQVS